MHAGQLYKYGVDRAERMPPTMVARIGADAATALHYAHEVRNQSGQPLGLVHRDVSPANIMVSFDGVVKLCDFGIAKAAMLGDQLTNPGQVKGKYAYMSPEQTIGAPLDGRSDVFSLAILLWSCSRARRSSGAGMPWRRCARSGMASRPRSSRPPRKTPPALAKAITRALQTRREIRATAMDFAQALEQFIKSSPELATPMQLGGCAPAVHARGHRAAPGDPDPGRLDRHAASAAHDARARHRRGRRDAGVHGHGGGHHHAAVEHHRRVPRAVRRGHPRDRGDHRDHRGGGAHREEGRRARQRDRDRAGGGPAASPAPPGGLHAAARARDHGARWRERQRHDQRRDRAAQRRVQAAGRRGPRSCRRRSRARSSGSARPSRSIRPRGCRGAGAPGSPSRSVAWCCSGS
ncbi:MAG: serine/threonine protein kinase [Myxococcales bacterium]|nr:serine/threonine protein kinase [Myxococcales bacterium]